MRIHNKNNVMDEEIWLFLQYTKQDNEVNQKNLDIIIINIMINPILKEGR